MNIWTSDIFKRYSNKIILWWRFQTLKAVFECPSLRGKRIDKWDWSNFHKTTIRRESNRKKNKDFLAVEIPSEIKKLTKRTASQNLASIYDYLGEISPTTIIGKILSDICNSKISCDKTVVDLIDTNGRNGRKNYQQKYKSSRPEVFRKKGVLRKKVFYSQNS